MEAPFDARAYWDAILKAGPFPGATGFLGFELIDYSPVEGWCAAWFTLPEAAKNPGGNAQGGFISAALDEIMSLAGSVVQEGPAMAPTLQMTTSFIRPVPIGERLTARGNVVRRGRAAIFTEGWLKSEDGTLLATATASCIPRLMNAYDSDPSPRPSTSSG